MSQLMPKTATAKDVQSNYRRLFDEVMRTEEPIVVLNNNKPEVVILSIKTYEFLAETHETHEQEMAQRAIEIYNKEEKAKKLKKLSSLADLT